MEKEIVIENSGLSKLQTKVFEALGEASMSWSETPTGVFDSTNAERIGDELMGFCKEAIKEACKKQRENCLFNLINAPEPENL